MATFWEENGEGGEASDVVNKKVNTRNAVNKTPNDKTAYSMEKAWIRAQRTELHRPAVPHTPG